MTELKREIIDPSSPLSTIRVVDYDILPLRLRSAEKFKAAVQRLCPNDTLSLTFPNVLDHKKATGYGIEYLNRLTTLPDALLNSETFTSDAELRGPVEEIILITNAQRLESGLPFLDVIGNGWSQYFKVRMSLMSKNNKIRDNAEGGQGVNSLEEPATTALPKELPKARKRKPHQWTRKKGSRSMSEQHLSEALSILDDSEEPESPYPTSETSPHYYRNHLGEIVENGHVLPHDPQE